MRRVSIAERYGFPLSIHSSYRTLAHPPAAPKQTTAQMSRYLIGAVIALAIDYAIVWSALRLGLHPWFARALGLLAGVTTTYFFNRRFTFDVVAAPSVREWSRYFLLQLVGSALNFAVSTIGLYWGDRSTLHVALAILAGAVVGFSYNFFAARRVLQRTHRN
jgi:putative flippase GtrA